MTPNIPNVISTLASLLVETLEGLRLLYLSGDHAAQDVISDLVLRTMATLHSIEVSSNPSDAAIRHVTRLPSLNDATVRLVSPDRQAASPDPISPSLRTLETRVVGKGGWKYLMEYTVNLESIVSHQLNVLHLGEVAYVFGFLINQGFHRTIRGVI